MTHEELNTKLSKIYTDIQTALDLARQGLLKSERKHQVISNSNQGLLGLKAEFGEVEQLRMEKAIPDMILMPRSGRFVSEEDAKKDLTPLLEITKHLMGILGGKIPKKDMFVTKDAPYEGRKILRSIFNQAKSKLLIVDGYLRPEILEVLQLNLEDVIGLELNFLTQKGRFFSTFSSDLGKLREQYPDHIMTLKYYDSLPQHDRYVIIDGDVVYHSGHSLAELGNRASSLSKVEGDAREKALMHIIDIWETGA